MRRGFSLCTLFLFYFRKAWNNHFCAQGSSLLTVLIMKPEKVMKGNKMKQRSQMVILFVGLLLMSSVAFAQPGQRQSQRPSLPDNSQISKMVVDLSQSLDLNKSQKAEVAKLYTEHFTQAKRLMEKGKSEKIDQRKAMDKLKKKLDKKILSGLNREQKAKYKAYQKSHDPRKDQGRKPEKLHK